MIRTRSLPLLSEDAARAVLDGFRAADGNPREADDDTAGEFCDRCGQFTREPQTIEAPNGQIVVCPACAKPDATDDDDESPLLSRDERDAIRAKVHADTFDDLDARVLCDHADEATRLYEELSIRSQQRADEATVGYFRRDEKIHALVTRLGALRATIAYCLSRVPQAMSATDALAEIARVAHSHEEPKS